MAPNSRHDATRRDSFVASGRAVQVGYKLQTASDNDSDNDPLSHCVLFVSDYLARIFSPVLLSSLVHIT